ncbi:MAG: hypothetical protein QOF33_482 [Thermomicrobiales bacterium]|nr:hypothetical protein [Thermomicrobiales bacterium]
MNLFCKVEFQRQRGNLHWRKFGEGEEIGQSKAVRRQVEQFAKADVEPNSFEAATGQRYVQLMPNRCRLLQEWNGNLLHYFKLKEASEGGVRRREHILCRGHLAFVVGEIDDLVPAGN